MTTSLEQPPATLLTKSAPRTDKLPAADMSIEQVLQAVDLLPPEAPPAQQTPVEAVDVAADPQPVPKFSRPLSPYAARFSVLWTASGAVLTSALVLQANPQPLGLSLLYWGVPAAICGALVASLLLSLLMDSDY